MTEKGVEVRRGGRITVTCQEAVRVFCCRRNDSELTSGPSNAKSISSDHEQPTTTYPLHHQT